MEKTARLVIFGDSAFAEIAHEYFQHDSPYEVVAFTVSRSYLTRSELNGLPVIAWEDLPLVHPPGAVAMHVALVYTDLNRPRMRFYEEARARGYMLANYVSSRAFVWRNVTLGDNVFVFEDNTVQPFVTLGSNLVLWSGNHIGHHTTVHDHTFISSHVVISGFCEIGRSCFFGVNSTVGNNVVVGDDCLVGSGALIVRDTPAGSLLKGPMTRPDETTTWARFGIPTPPAQAA